MGQANPIRDTALIVEDDYEIRCLAAAILEETDLRVVETDSAEEALHFLRDNAQKVALVFADIRLPCLMDGVDLARTINLKWPWIKMVVTSGDPGDRLAELPRGASYMPKPWRALDVLVEAERVAQKG
jgi:CheY-like chemotaxis protein